MSEDKKINQFDENGKRHGYWKNYFANGKLWFEGTYINGSADGFLQKYWSNGNLWHRGNYINGKLNGYWELYNRKGKLVTIEYFL